MAATAPPAESPSKHWPASGFYWALGSMFAVTAVMLLWLRSSKWL